MQHIPVIANKVKRSLFGISDTLSNAANGVEVYILGGVHIVQVVSNQPICTTIDVKAKTMFTQCDGI